MDESLIHGLQRALADFCTVEAIRAIEAGADTRALWQTVLSLGYADAFVGGPEGGIDLALPQAFVVGQALGRAGFPLPLLETAVARKLLLEAGFEPPDDRPMLPCDGARTVSGVAVPETPGLRTAGHLLLHHGGHWHLVEVEAAGVHAGIYRPNLSGRIDAIDLSRAKARFPALRTAQELCAPLQAAEMAGSMAAVLEMTVTYAGDRRQFGKPIGAFQALQQDIAVLGEHVAFVSLAARLGCRGGVAQPDPNWAACGRLLACRSVERVVGIAHAVHGAIGITEEYPLGIYARRLLEWRHVGASPNACAQRLGRAALGHSGGLLDFVREALPSH